MKNIKRILALVLALAMVLSMSAFVFASEGGEPERPLDDPTGGDTDDPTGGDEEPSGGDEEPTTPRATTGSITITNPQEGVTYTAHKIFDLSFAETNTDGTGGTNPYNYYIDATSVWCADVLAYAQVHGDVDAEEPEENNGLILDPVLNESGTIKGYNVAFNENFSAAEFAAYLKGKADSKTGGTSFTSSIKNLPFGYYLVSPTTAGTVASLTSTDPDVEITDKNEKPEVEKVIIDTMSQANEFITKGDATYTAYQLFQTNSKVEWGNGIDAEGFNAAALEDEELKALFDNLSYEAPEYSANAGDTAAYKWNAVYTADVMDNFIDAAKDNLATGTNAQGTVVAGATYIVKQEYTIPEEKDADDIVTKPAETVVNYVIVTPSTSSIDLETAFAEDYKDPDNPDPAPAELPEQSDEYKQNEAGIGEKVQYQLTAEVPDMTGYKFYFFVVNDLMSKGLTFNDDVEITLDGDTLTDPDDYTVKAEPVMKDGKPTGETEIRIVFKDMIQYYDSNPANDLTGAPIVIKYSATVNQDALIGAANKNTAKIEFSNDPTIVPEWDEKESPDDPTDPDDHDEYDPRDPGYEWNDPEAEDPNAPIDEGPDSSTETYVSAVELTKVDGAGNTLKGAKFKISGSNQKVVIVNETIFEKYTSTGAEDKTTLYYRLKNGKYTTEAPSAGGEIVKYEKYSGDRFRYEQTEDSLGTGLYYKNTSTGAYVKITDDNIGTVNPDAILYKIIYTTPGLYYKEIVESLDENVEPVINYVQITEERASDEDLLTTDLYQAVLSSSNEDDYESTTQTYKKVEVVNKDSKYENFEAEGWVDEECKLNFTGLGAGTYEITEMVAPDGYNILTAPITLKISFDYDSKTFSASVDGSDATVTSGTISFNVVNKQGTELPETGGIGTTIFYILGSILLVGAAVLLITKKRMSAKA